MTAEQIAKKIRVDQMNTDNAVMRGHHVQLIEDYADQKALSIIEKAWKDVVMDMTTEEARGASRLSIRVKKELGVE